MLKARSQAAAPSRHTVKWSQKGVDALRREIRQHYDANGFLSWSAAKRKYIILGTNEPDGGLARCPECGLGQIVMVRSRTTRKRFLGCSNYQNGCTASAPLLQKARLRALKKTCDVCRWPLVIFRYSRKQKWTRQCANHNCTTRAPRV